LGKQALAEENYFGELLAIDRSNACLQLGTVCYEIAPNEKDSILEQASRIGVGATIIIIVENGKVVEVDSLNQESQAE
jgi:hypothetical protein